MSVVRVVFACLFVMLAGCAGTPDAVFDEPQPDDVRFAPVQPIESAREVVSTGSLFDSGRANSLYSDVKARRVGDLITVMLQESTKAKKSASSGSGRSSSVSVATPTIMGQPVPSLGLEMGADTSFSGNGAADQSNSLSGSISVHVEQVLANGNLVVRGEKWLTLNTGNEYIRLTGIIRPEDVAFDNTVSSSRVANARIEFSGTGSLAQAQTKGWLSNFFTDVLWPF